MTLYRHSSLKVVCGLNFKSYKVDISLKTFLDGALNSNIIFTTSLVGIMYNKNKPRIYQVISISSWTKTMDL